MSLAHVGIRVGTREWTRWFTWLESLWLGTITYERGWDAFVCKLWPAIFSEAARALAYGKFCQGRGRSSWESVCVYAYSYMSHVYDRGITLHCGTLLMVVPLRTWFQEVTIRAASFIIQAENITHKLQNHIRIIMLIKLGYSFWCTNRVFFVIHPVAVWTNPRLESLPPPHLFIASCPAVMYFLARIAGCGWWLIDRRDHHV